MQGAGVKKTRSVCSERARTPAGGRSRCGFAKQIRGFSAQGPSPKQMCCRWHFCQLCPHTNGSPVPWRIELYAGRGRKENAASTQAGTRFPNGGPGGKSIPESALRLGRSFRMMPQAETATRNRAVEWDMLSQWQLKRKVHPGILVRNGMQFPNEWLAESSSRNPRSERDALSQRRSKRKAHPGISPQTGTRFPLHLPPRKTHALAIPKLGRRKPKRNRRRSI